MTTKTKTKRTQLKDLAVAEQELTKPEARRVKGGIAVNDPGMPPEKCSCGKSYNHSGPHAGKK